MPTTRKKVIKTVYKNEDSEEDGDFSDSGSDAKFSAQEESSSEEDVADYAPSSGDEFDSKSKAKPKNLKVTTRKPKYNIKTLINKLSKQSTGNENDEDVTPALFSVKDLTEADKLLPPILNLSESDSSDDESPKISKKSSLPENLPVIHDKNENSDSDADMEYKDVFSNNIQDNSEEIARKTFLELEKHKSKVEETKASLQNYTLKLNSQKELDVCDLLAMGEEVIPEVLETAKVKKKTKSRRKNDDSDSEMEELEEVQETKEIPKQGIQLFVEFPDAACRKKKTVDVEMMMKRKINRVKKEYQVYMHKVHVLCWLGHGNFVSRVLNDQELMAAVLSLVPSKECYPGERVDMKYVEQITIWYKDKLTLKQDKHEDKFKPKAPPLKTILLEQIKNRVVTTKKYLVFIFVTMLRALGLQCRVMFNFVTLPIKPPSTELCSLSTKPKDVKASTSNKSETPTEKKEVKKEVKIKQKAGSTSTQSKKSKLAQVDGNDDCSFDSDDENIMQVDGNDDTITRGTRKTRSTKRAKTGENNSEKGEDEDVSPPKVPKKSSGRASPKPKTKLDENKQIDSNKRTQKDKKEIDDGLAEQSIKQKSKTESSSSLPSKIDSPAKVTANTKNRVQRNKIPTKASENNSEKVKDDDVSPPKVPKKSTSRASPKPTKKLDENKRKDNSEHTQKAKKNVDSLVEQSIQDELKAESSSRLPLTKDSPAKITANTRTRVQRSSKNAAKASIENVKDIPKIMVTDENATDVSSKYFEDNTSSVRNSRLSRKRSHTVNPEASQSKGKVVDKEKVVKTKARTKSAPNTAVEKSKYFEDDKLKLTTPKRSARQIKEEDSQRVSHRDLAKKKIGKSDVTGDLVDIIKTRIKDAKLESQKGIVKGKIKKESDEDSDYLPQHITDSDDDFKPTKISPRPSKISPKPSTSRRIDRRVLSSSSEEPKKKANAIDVWCEIFVEELEQWISVDVIKGKVHSVGDLYTNATHPVCYVIGWDNNNYLKDLTRKYVPHWNTVTRKLRAEPLWWDTAIKPWLGPKTARDKEEDEYLDRMQLEAPLPKSIAEYKNHPLYALKRHLLKFEAIYPADAAVLGFVRNEPVYARECVYTCRSRDTWLKEAKVVRLGEKPYKVVKARPKWDKLSNKLITDKPLEVFGPWQVQEYEPPTAENGIVPRNAYGNVELFKDCMLPKGTVHIKLPGLNRVAKKLNIDCAPAMTGFDFNGGWSHPVYDGFVVCKEFEEIITEAWVKDQEEQERRELEKTEARVYGNWKRLIKGLLIRERLKCKYGFEEPTSSETSKKSKGPRLVVKKRS